MTLIEIESSAFSKVIERLKPDICYVDSADVNYKRFGNQILSHLSFKPTIISKHKADELYPIVGAASILAKTKRDECVSKIAKEFREKLDLPVGSGYPADPVTRNFLKAWVEKFKELPPHVRRSWKTSKEIMKGT
jgi:ribonuclease HII